MAAGYAAARADCGDEGVAGGTRGRAEDDFCQRGCGHCARDGAGVCRRGMRRDLEFERVPHGSQCAAGDSGGECRPSAPDRGTAVAQGVGRVHCYQSNCSTIGLVLALKPIEERFGIEQIFVDHDAGGQRRGLSGRGVDGHSGQCGSLYRRRRREDGSGDAEAAGQAGGPGGEAAGVRG